jgi:hypothetical protein
MAQVNAGISAENDHHAEVVAQIAQAAQFQADNVALKKAEDAETVRHNGVLETLQAQATQMQQTLETMREQNAIQLQQMQEATQVKLAQMSEGAAIYEQQGQQAFTDWQTRQKNRMDILNSALNNPWLQQLTGMMPDPSVQGGVTGGQNLARIIQQIQQAFDPNQWGVANAPSVAGLGPTTPGGGGTPGGAPPQQGTNVFSGGGAPQIDTPSWSQWQGWSPFQKAAYRTNIEALGPGVWNQVQQGLQGGFAQQGGTPNVTQMQAAAADPTQSIGQQMTANVFGQTAPQWQANQQKIWSQSQAPRVQTSLTGGAKGIAA